MKHTIRLLAVAAASLTALGAQAQSVYGELGYSALEYQENSAAFRSTIKPGMVRGIVGYELSPNLAAEAMLGLGMGSDDVRVGGVTVKGKVDNMVGAFIKPKVKIGESFELFGRLGATSTKVSASSGGFSVSDRGTGLAYGGGASYSFTPQLSINADYMNYYDRKGVKVDGITVGVGFRF